MHDIYIVIYHAICNGIIKGAAYAAKGKNQSIIIEAAFDIARSDEIDKLNARTISERLKCSTQPIFYHFSSIEEIRKSVYEKADMYHSEFVMPKGANGVSPFMELGQNYIRFAFEEKKLFQFLFQAIHFNRLPPRWRMLNRSFVCAMRRGVRHRLLFNGVMTRLCCV